MKRFLFPMFAVVLLFTSCATPSGTSSSPPSTTSTAGATDSSLSPVSSAPKAGYEDYVQAQYADYTDDSLRGQLIIIQGTISKLYFVYSDYALCEITTDEGTWYLDIGNTTYCEEELVRQKLSIGQTITGYGIYTGNDSIDKVPYCSILQMSPETARNHIETETENVYWTDFIDYNIQNNEPTQIYTVGDISYSAHETWRSNEIADSTGYAHIHPTTACMFEASYNAVALTNLEITDIADNISTILGSLMSNLELLDQPVFSLPDEEIICTPFTATGEDNTYGIYGLHIIYKSHPYIFLATIKNRSTDSFIETINMIFNSIEFH